MQRISLFHLFILQIQSVLQSCHQIGHSRFWLCLCQSSFYLHKFVTSCKKSVSSICSFLRYSLESRIQIGEIYILTMPDQKHLKQLLIFVNLYQHAKSESAILICSGEKIHLKILQSDWLRAFWPISKKQNFSQT